MYIHICTCIYVQIFWLRGQKRSNRVCVFRTVVKIKRNFEINTDRLIDKLSIHMYIHIYIHIHIHTRTHTHTYTHTYTHTCLY